MEEPLEEPQAAETPKEPFFKRVFRAFFKEKYAASLGPVYFMRAPWLHIVLGWLLAAAILVLLFLGRKEFADESAETLGIWYSTSFLVGLSIIIGVLFSFRLKIRGKTGFGASTLLFALVPFATYYMVEFLNGMEAYDRKPEYIFMNIICYGLVYLLFLVFFGNFRWAVITATLLFYAFAVICYFVMIFRGTPFVPLDILSGGTAANVAEHYDFEFAPRWVIATVQTGLIMGLGFQLGKGNLKRFRWKISLRALAAFIVLGLVTSFFNQAYFDEKGLTISYWNQQVSYEKFGDWLAFCINLRNVYPERPADYDAKTVDEIVTNTLRADKIDPDGNSAMRMTSGVGDYVPGGEAPNIIVIMNESFTDLQNMGEGFETNREVLPFFNDLKENTIRGRLQVSVAGGGTACTEYEVLTANSQRFMPNGAVAYSANIHDNMPSLAWTLGEQGYSTQAFHPYYVSGWNREKVYDYLGFEEKIFLEDILPEEMCDMNPADRMQAVESIDPDDGDVYNRDYMSDHYDYKIVRELYENRDKSKPFFLFNVTIQNHGGYAEGAANFEEEIHITDMEGSYPQTNRYLSLVHASDEALEELITYFRDEVEEPTLIVFYGDHIPSVEESFYSELFGGKSVGDLSEEEYMTRFQTPFIIWGNYDIPEKDVGLISANYLSTLILETAGREMPDYNRYLASLYEEVPVISTMGIVDSKGNASTNPKNENVQGLVEGYQALCYNNLYDYSHRDWRLFTLDGQSLDPDAE